MTKNDLARYKQIGAGEEFDQSNQMLLPVRDSLVQCSRDSFAERNVMDFESDSCSPAMRIQKRKSSLLRNTLVSEVPVIREEEQHGLASDSDDAPVLE